MCFWLLVPFKGMMVPRPNRVVEIRKAYSACSGESVGANASRCGEVRRSGLAERVQNDWNFAPYLWHRERMGRPYA